MTSRRSPHRLLFTFGTLALMAGSSGVAISACSSDETSGTNPGADGAVDATTERKSVDSASPPQEDAKPQETSSECIARCGKTHPNSVAKYNSVDTCWGAKCMGPCVDQNGMFTPGDAGDAGDGGTEAGRKVHDGGTDLCTSTYSSAVDKACDDCTEAFCCTEWDSCYKDMDCQEYNDCLADCP